MKNVIILDNRPYIRYRVKDLIEKGEVTVHEAASSTQLIAKLNELKNDVHLLIVEVNLKDEDGIEIIKNLKKRNINIPFMVLTFLNTRDTFIRAVKEGAVDYFLKPFDNKLFYDRVTRHAKGDTSILAQRPIESLAKELPFRAYFNEEIEKATKGKYKLSAVMTIYFKSNVDITLDLHNDNVILTDYIYNKLRDLIPEGGRFSKYGGRTFVSVFPFCDEVQISNINKEMLEKINHIKSSDSVASNYFFTNVIATFPQEGVSAQEVLDKLTEKLKLKIKEEQVRSNK